MIRKRVAAARRFGHYAWVILTIFVSFAASYWDPAWEDEIRDHVRRPYDVEPSSPDDPWVREIRVMPERARGEARTAASQAIYMRQYKEADIWRRAQLGREVRSVRGDTRQLCQRVHSRARHEYGRELRHTRATMRAGSLAQLYMEEGGAFDGFREFLEQHLASEDALDDDDDGGGGGHDGGRLAIYEYGDSLDGDYEDDESGGSGSDDGNGGFALTAATTWAGPDVEALILESQAAETVDHARACDWASSLTEVQREAILEMMRTGGDGYAEDYSFVMELLLCTHLEPAPLAPTSQLDSTTPEQGLVFQGQSATTPVVVLQDGSPAAAQADEPARSARVKRSRRGGQRRPRA
jgi:hypothetical protein